MNKIELKDIKHHKQDESPQVDQEIVTQQKRQEKLIQIIKKEEK